MIVVDHIELDQPMEEGAPLMPEQVQRHIRCRMRGAAGVAYIEQPMIGAQIETEDGLQPIDGLATLPVANVIVKRDSAWHVRVEFEVPEV